MCYQIDPGQSSRNAEEGDQRRRQPHDQHYRNHIARASNDTWRWTAGAEHR